MMDKTQLTEMWADLAQLSYIVGNANITDIYIITDGNGPCGMYDRIHIISEDGSERIYPAHNCSGWQYARKEKTQ